jgi:hypothetical protein
VWDGDQVVRTGPLEKPSTASGSEPTVWDGDTNIPRHTVSVYFLVVLSPPCGMVTACLQTRSLERASTQDNWRSEPTAWDGDYESRGS